MTPTPAPAPGSDVSTSIIRTVTPIAVGIVVALVAHLGFKVDNATATALIAPVVAAVYHVAARLLETYVSPSYGRLLGRAALPRYVKAA